VTARKELWRKFDAEIARVTAKKPAPAFIQEVVKGLWSVQVLCIDDRRYGRYYRLFNDPPYVPVSYYGWPGDHRGWMRFESKESARDFYRFATRRISMEQYQNLPHTESSDVRIDLDDDGNFVEER